MESILGLSSLLAFVVSVVVLIVFFVMASNIGTLVRLIRHQNDLLKGIYKQNGGKIINELTGKEE